MNCYFSTTISRTVALSFIHGDTNNESSSSDWHKQTNKAKFVSANVEKQDSSEKSIKIGHKEKIPEKSNDKHDTKTNSES